MPCPSSEYLPDYSLNLPGHPKGGTTILLFHSKGSKTQRGHLTCPKALNWYLRSSLAPVSMHFISSLVTYIILHVSKTTLKTT